MGKAIIDELDKKSSSWGLKIYDIAEDGCLNGTWTNNGLLTNDGHHSEMMNEIAKKITNPIKVIPEEIKEIFNNYSKNEKEQNYKDNLPGYYWLSWIELDNDEGVVIAWLKIIPQNNGVYILLWVDDKLKKITFEGRGLKIGENKLAVIYSGV